jgi:hypothetical protein
MPPVPDWAAQYLSAAAALQAAAPAAAAAMLAAALSTAPTAALPMDKMRVPFRVPAARKDLRASLLAAGACAARAMFAIVAPPPAQAPACLSAAPALRLGAPAAAPASAASAAAAHLVVVTAASAAYLLDVAAGLQTDRLPDNLQPHRYCSHLAELLWLPGPWLGQLPAWICSTSASFQVF